MLRDDQKALYARHVLLPELGEAGQATLCASQMAISAAADTEAASVAADYLARSGVTVASRAGLTIDVADNATLSALSVDPRLRHAAAWFHGAWAAVEAIKQLTHAGQPAPGALASSAFSLSGGVRS